ncbi:MAG: RagB/SusD family nutrient uptake outer membrane protein [Paludibacter sp.]|nr:RagB/SusD family nutrient uptake outer membrane protein [Paludibacter sp.]
MKLFKITTGITFLALLSVSFSSCQDMLDTNAKEVVESSENYHNVYDADNAIWGLYGKVQNLAENVVVLNELRADLMDVTTNATQDQVDLNSHRETATNKYCDPTPFYEVILNANDILYNFKKMLAENKISKENYVPRYADVLAIRCWAYLQLGMHFKDIAYVTNPLQTVDSLSIHDLFPTKSLDELIPQLISEMESLPTLETNTLSSFYGKTISDNGKSFYLNLQFIDKHILLGDLYLWNDQYVQAATQYKAYMDAADAISSKTNIENKISTWVWSGSNEPRFQITYQRYKDQDVTSFRNMWKEIFYRSSTDAGTSGSIGLQDEMIWMMSFSGSANSVSPFIKLFANTGQGQYQLKPSSYAIDSLWNTQVQQSNGFVFDGRGRESSYDNVNGQPVVLKYLYDYYAAGNPDANKTIHLNYFSFANPYSKPGKWFLYRAALLHLRYAEAANRAGYPRLAYSLLNNGIKANYDWTASTGTTRTDKSGVQYTSFPPVIPIAIQIPVGASQDTINAIKNRYKLYEESIPSKPYPAPFYLDARQNDVPYTFLRSPWRDNGGIRGRAFLLNITKPDGIVTTADSIQWIEKALIKEAALECGFEGHRWGDLLRIARRNNKRDGGNSVATIMNAAVAHKFNASGSGSASITDGNLFLPMKK